MNILIDFDRTLFDTEQFVKYIIDERLQNQEDVNPTINLSTRLDQMVKRGEITFSKGELKRFLYPDGIRFIQKCQYPITIITSGNPYLQKAKIDSALSFKAQIDLIFAKGQRKADIITSLLGNDVKGVYVDDNFEEVQYANSILRNMKCYHMVRDIKENTYISLSSLISMVKCLNSNTPPKERSLPNKRLHRDGQPSAPLQVGRL